MQNEISKSKQCHNSEITAIEVAATCRTGMKKERTGADFRGVDGVLLLVVLGIGCRVLNILRLEETDVVGVRLSGTVRQKVPSSFLPPSSHPLVPPMGQNLQEA